jgi:hypothetical protein
MRPLVISERLALLLAVICLIAGVAELIQVRVIDGLCLGFLSANLIYLVVNSAKQST